MFQSVYFVPFTLFLGFRIFLVFSSVAGMKSAYYKRDFPIEIAQFETRCVFDVNCKQSLTRHSESGTKRPKPTTLKNDAFAVVNHKSFGHSEVLVWFRDGTIRGGH